MNTFLKRLLIVSIVLIIALVGTNVIYAQGPSDGNQSRRHPRVRFAVARALIMETAEATSTDPIDVLQARRDGQSLNDYLAANGGNSDAVVAAILENAEERLSQAVENNRIDQVKADEMLVNLEQKIVEAMASTGLPGNQLPPFRDRDRDQLRDRLQLMDGTLVDILTDSTGLSNEELAQELRGGSTPAELIEANGGNVDTVTQQIVTAITEAINQAVEDDRMDENRANQLLENLEEKVVERLTNPHPMQRFRNRSGGRFGSAIGNS